MTGGGVEPVVTQSRVFVGRSHAEVLDLEFEDTDPDLVQDLVPRGVLMTTTGLPETYKGWVATHLSRGIAAGEGEIFGCKVTGKGPVGYFWQDDSERNEAARIKLFAEALNTPRELAIRWHLNEGLALPDDIDRLRATIEHYGYVFVTLDSWYNVAARLDLKEREAGSVFAQLKTEICDVTGCTINVVDHMPWATETNRKRLRSYGDVFKNAAVRAGIYIDAEGSKLWVEARGNNVRGFKRAPAYWDPDRLELRLVDTPDETDEAGGDALEWIVGYVSQQYAATGTGVARGKIETAYHEAHNKHGRNLARRIIDRQIEAYTFWATGENNGETPTPLSTGPGETTHGTYLYPSEHAVSPLAAPPNGDSGENPPPTVSRDSESTHSPVSPPSYREGANGERVRTPSNNHPNDLSDDELEDLLNRHHDLTVSPE